jgi:hypothetical protein
MQLQASTRFTRFQKSISDINVFKSLVAQYQVQEVSCTEEAWTYLNQLTSNKPSDH